MRTPETTDKKKQNNKKADLTDHGGLHYLDVEVHGEVELAHAGGGDDSAVIQGY
jgi:hypothetical protein